MSMMALGATAWRRHGAPLPSGLPAEILADSPLWYGRHNEAAGPACVNHAGGLNGAYSDVSALRFQQPAIHPGGDLCKFFNGNTSADRAVLPSALLPSAEALTLEFIIRPTVISGLSQIITRDAGSSNPRAWQMRCNSGSLDFIKIVGGVQSITVPSFFAVDTTVHGVVSISTLGAVAIYKNGSLAGSASFSGADYGGGGRDISINAFDVGGGDYGDAYFSVTAIYDHVLSPARVLAHAQAAGLA